MVAITTQRRLRTLEGSGGGKPPCDRCGWGGDNGEPDEPDPDGAYEVFFEDELPDDLEENCPECGRALVINIYFDDLRAPWNRGA